MTTVWVVALFQVFKGCLGGDCRAGLGMRVEWVRAGWRARVQGLRSCEVAKKLSAIALPKPLLTEPTDGRRGPDLPAAVAERGRRTGAYWRCGLPAQCKMQADGVLGYRVVEVALPPQALDANPHR